jgi:hypothetical protein
MIVVETFVKPVPQELIDPDYANRSTYLAQFYDKTATHSHSSEPRVIGSVADKDWFSSAVPNLGNGRTAKRDIDIRLRYEFDKETGAIKYKLRDDLAQFSEFVALVASFEHSAYPDADYLEDPYLTVDQSLTRNGRQQRADGRKSILHRDGYPDWYHVYTAADVFPTLAMSIEQPVRDSETISTKRALALGGKSIAAAAYDITAFNSTTFHQPPTMEVPDLQDGARINRTFVRLLYDHYTSA